MTWHTHRRLSSTKQKVQNFPHWHSSGNYKIHSPPTELLNSNFFPTNTLHNRAKSFPDVPELAVSALEKSPSSKSRIMESREDTELQNKLERKQRFGARSTGEKKPEQQNRANKNIKPKKPPKPTDEQNRETRVPQPPVLKAGNKAGCPPAGQGAGVSNRRRPG